jgi:hypothetical protein
MNPLVSKAFDIQSQIQKLMPENHLLVDAGMFIPDGSETELWRDMTVLVDEETEYSFSYSTDGNLKGDVPPKMTIDVNSVLAIIK